MKHIAGLMGLGSLYAGALWTEYQIALLLGTGCVLFAGGSALAIMVVALLHAREGYERPDGFHLRRDETPSVLPAIRSLRRQVQRGWT